MSARGYVLVVVTAGRMGDVSERLSTIPEIKWVDRVIGPYDVIAVLEAPDLTAIGDLLTHHIHKIDGIARTVTCMAIEQDWD